MEPHDIEIGARAGESFVVLKGLQAGQKVVTSANFLIDSESQLQAAMGSFAPPPPGAGAARCPAGDLGRERASDPPNAMRSAGPGIDKVLRRLNDD